jgi:Ca2+-binding RTX toxin-like protein
VNDFEVVIGSKFDDTLDGYQELDGGYGNDKITGTYYADMLTGGYGNDTMNGFQNNDVLMGGDGDDVINGGDGDDRMDGGDGFDTLNGENGTDILAFGASWGAINLNISTGKATSMSGVVFTDTFTGFEIYQGSGGADSITGSSVNDTILGSLGSDTLSAGAGTDKLSYRDINFGVVVDTSGVVSFAGFTQSISGFEIYAGTNYNDKITGSALAETIDGGEGRDTLDGGAGVDMLSYDSAVAGMVIDISNNMAYYSPTSPFTNLVSIADMFTNFEAYTGTIYADTIRGSTASESIFGGNGNDIVDGGDGNDSISGGSGGDTLVGGAGNDTIDGGSASDTLDGGAGIDTYIAAGYRVNVNAVTGLSIAYASPTLTTVDSTDTISNFESYIGAYGNDTIVGSYLSETIDGGNGNDVISGGDGNDTIYCSAGNDTLDGGNGVDLLVSNVGLSVNLNTGTASLWNGLGLPFSNTKLATLTISNFESFKGGDYNDTLIGAAANDTFEGAAGSDSISGGAGNDFIDGSVGNDTLDGGIGIDTLSYDTLKYLPNRALVMDVTANSFATWLVDNSNKQASLQNLDTVSNFEVYVGTVMGDTMKGGVASETIDGALGGDLLDGRAGDDVLIGGAGNDIFVFAANAGKDHIKDFDDGYTTAETVVMYDMIDLGGRADVTGFADVMARAVQVGTDTVITFTGGDVLTLDGVDKLSLTTFDFTNY